MFQVIFEQFDNGFILNWFIAPMKSCTLSIALITSGNFVRNISV